MKILLDTNICIYLIKRQPDAVIQKLLASRVGDVGISIISVAELRYGASKSGRPKKNHEALDQFLSPFEIAGFDERAAIVYGQIRTAVEQKGRPIGPMDLLIASQALSLDVGLATNDVKELRQVPGLRVENWVS